MKNRSDLTPALIKELELRRDYLGESAIDSIYFGGGTPSILPAIEIHELINAVKDRFITSDKLEITLEANPENITDSYLEELKSTGVNRFSLGIQSFHEEDLVWMNRAHNAVEARSCIELCQKHGFESFSIDLIFGIPKSSIEKWQENIDTLLFFRPNHVSCYALTVEDKTALAHHVKSGKSIAPNDAETEQQFLYTHDKLIEAGYIHYEISNYALPGKESLHNSSYWKGSYYLGIGPAAHSFNGDSRSWNIAHLPKYLKAIKENRVEMSTEILSTTDKYNEWVMTSIRKKEGVSMKVLKSEFSQFEKYFLDAKESIPTEYIEISEDWLRLSRKGMLFGDFVGSELFFVDET